MSYFRARYYDSGNINDSIPLVGRFLSRDPMGLAAGINVYAFGGNDPINMADPSGKTPLSPAQMQAGVDGLIQQDRINTFLAGFGLSSSNQNLEAADGRPRISNTDISMQTALAATSFVPGLGTVSGLVSANTLGHGHTRHGRSGEPSRRPSSSIGRQTVTHLLSR